MIINQSSLSALFTSYDAAFRRGFTTVEPEWDKLATLIRSNSASNLYAWLGQFPKFREWLGDRVIQNMKAHNYTLVNKDYEATVGVSRNDIQDDQYGVYEPLMEEMGAAAAVHPDELVFAALDAGNASECYDGQFFFDTDHPVIESGAATTKANRVDNADAIATKWYLLDTRRPLKPLIFQKRRDYDFQAMQSAEDENVFMSKEFRYGVDTRSVAGYGLWQLAYESNDELNATNYDAAVTAMMGLKSDQDRPLGIRPNLLVCGTTRRAQARSLLQTQYLASGADNPNYQDVEVLVTSHLA